MLNFFQAYTKWYLHLEGGLEVHVKLASPYFDFFFFPILIFLLRPGIKLFFPGKWKNLEFYIFLYEIIAPQKKLHTFINM